MSLGNAIGYLTALRVPPRRQVPLAHSIHYFPLLGAAIGSVAILFFLAVDRFLPGVVSCLLTVVLVQVLSGWGSLRGVAEALQREHTLPGYGFRPGFRLDARGAWALGGLLAFKWVALSVLPPDWQTRAVFVYPILGYCARTAAFLIGPVKGDGRGVLQSRRRVRAGFLGGALLFLVFLFPLRLALPLLLAGAAAVLWTLRHRARHRGGMTLQFASVASEIAEDVLLLTVAVASFFL